MPSEKIFVRVSDTSITPEEIIQKAIEIKADAACHGRYGVQFFDNVPGLYLPEQITKNVELFKELQTAAFAVNSLIKSSANNGADTSKAESGLRRLLSEMKLSDLLPSD